MNKSDRDLGMDRDITRRAVNDLKELSGQGFFFPNLLAPLGKIFLDRPESANPQHFIPGVHPVAGVSPVSGGGKQYPVQQLGSPKPWRSCCVQAARFEGANP